MTAARVCFARASVGEVADLAGALMTTGSEYGAMARAEVTDLGYEDAARGTLAIAVIRANAEVTDLGYRSDLGCTLAPCAPCA